MHDPSTDQRPVDSSVDGAWNLLPVDCFIKGVNGKFTLRSNLTPHDLFGYFLVYLRDNKRYQPIPKQPHKN